MPTKFMALISNGRTVDVTDKKIKHTLLGQFRILFFNSWAHTLLLFVPAGFAVNYCHVNSIAVFAVNFVAIVPSAIDLAVAVDDLSLRVGEIHEGLISTTFRFVVQSKNSLELYNEFLTRNSNSVQLITSIFLLKSRQIDVLKTALIGSILSDLLLMTGLGFLLGGSRWHDQHFNVTVAQLLGSLLLLAATSLMVPTASYLLVNTTQNDILQQSRGTCVVMLLSYGLWLHFQFYTHADMFHVLGQKAPPREIERGTVKKGLATIGARFAGPLGDTLIQSRFKDDDEVDVPQLSISTAILAIVISTVLIAFNTKFATDSISGLLNEAGLTTTFVGLVILPLLSNERPDYVSDSIPRQNGSQPCFDDWEVHANGLDGNASVGHHRMGYGH